MELPPELMRAAKSRAAEQGESLKDWFARAVRLALGRIHSSTDGRRVRLPIIGSKRAGKIRLTNADIADLEAADDLENHRRMSR